MNNIAEQICEAVDIIVSQKIAKAGYDKTIQATILSCEDSNMGKYKVRFQNSSFIAYAANPSIRYQKDALVYILIPGNDMSKDKIIMNSVDKNIYDYTNVIEDNNKYQTIGGNAVVESKEVGLCSYIGSDSAVMYEVNNESINDELLKIDNELLIAAIKEGGYIRAKFTIETALDINQQSNGQYGISFELQYAKDTKSTVTLTSNQMTGNPYAFTTAREQVIYIPVNDASNLTGISAIKAFSKDFAKGESRQKDIFFSNLQLNGARLLTKEELSSIILKVSSKQEKYTARLSASGENIEIKANFLINGQTSTKEFVCYWYKENLLNYVNYDELAGIGWTKVKDKSNSEIINGEACSIYTFDPENLTAYENKYKCVAQFVGENELYSAEITIVNDAKSDYYIIILSDAGTTFYEELDTKDPTLTPIEHYPDEEGHSGTAQYVWKGVFEGNIEKYYYWNRMDPDGIVTWDSNRYGDIKIDISKIINSVTFYCYSYKESSYFGKGSITLINTNNSSSAYFDIQVKNGNQVYTYNKYGLSPTHNSLDVKQDIPDLRFDFINESGDIVPYSQIIKEEGQIRWKIPRYNTMIKLASPLNLENGDREEEDYYILNKRESLPYLIEDRFDINKNNNTIILEIIYQDIITTKEIKFTFLKDNDNKNNGTDTDFKLIPNYGGNVLLSYYFANDNQNLYCKSFPSDIFCNKSENTTITINNNLELFTPQLWKNGYLLPIVENDISWTILNKGSNLDASIFINDNKDKNFQILSTRNERNGKLYNHILRAEMIYKNKKYFTEMPMITINMHNVDYQIALKPNTGFQKVKYDKNGKNPSYDNLYPFEILIGDINNEIQSPSNYIYEWTIIGDKEYFYIVKQDNNKCFIAPLDTFSGDCFNAAVQVKVSNTEGEVGNIHIPIYLYLDREDVESLDGWDGNFISNQDEKILTPTGYGAVDNALFSGILFGQVKNENNLDQGLFLYRDGKRFLEATAAGNITLDTQGKGIVIANVDGIQFKSAINETNNSGFVINLASAEIKYFNNNFAIDKNGVIQALTLDESVQIDGKNIKGEVIDSSSGLGKILSNYVTIDSLNNILNNYVTITALNSTLNNYVTLTTLTNTLSNYVTTNNLTNTLNKYVTTTNFENLLNPSENNSIAPVISGGEITIGTFIVDATGEVAAQNATITNLIASNYKWENAENSTDTLDLIQEIKTLKEEVAALKEQLNGSTEQPEAPIE